MRSLRTGRPVGRRLLQRQEALGGGISNDLPLGGEDVRVRPKRADRKRAGQRGDGILEGDPAKAFSSYAWVICANVTS